MADSHHPNYKKIYFTLLALLVVSVAGPFLGIAWVTLLTAFGIALVKADMVVQNFMHLKWEKRIVRYILGGSVALMVLFYGAVAPDIQKHEGRNWTNDAAAAAVARGIPGPHTEAVTHDAAPAAAVPEGHGAESAAATAPADFDAAKAYATTCATCHGPAGGGDGAAAAALNPKPANFSDPAFWSSRTDAQIVKAIREGGVAVGKSATMPPWGSVYDDAKATALAAHLRTFSK